MSYSIHIFAIVGLGVLLDIISGIAQAIANKTLSSSKLRSGIYHKASYVIALALALFIEYAMGYLDLGFTIQLFPAVSAYIVLTEIVSVTENIARLNPELRDSPIFHLLSSNQKRREGDNDS